MDEQEPTALGIGHSLVSGAEMQSPRIEVAAPDGVVVAVRADGQRRVLVGPSVADDHAAIVECDLAQLAVVAELRSWTPAALTPVTNTGQTEYERGVQAGVRIASERLGRRADELLR